jgi:hypothetical protein
LRGAARSFRPSASVMGRRPVADFPFGLGLSFFAIFANVYEAARTPSARAFVM